MQIQSSRKIKFISTILLYAAPVAGVGTFCLIQKEDAINALSNFVITLILGGIYNTFLHVNQNYLYQKISKPLLYFGSFFLSCVLLGGSVGIPLGVFWMFAIVIAALNSGMELALSTHVVLMVQYVLLRLPKDSGFYRFLAYILLGLIVSLLFSQLKEKKSIPYLGLILVACDGVLQCVIYQFNLVKMGSHIEEILVELGSLLLFVGIGNVYLQRYKVSGEAAEAVVLQELTEPDYELLKRLKAYSDDLYTHSTRIGLLSEKAAKAIGGNAELAKAGGMYHEIGRIENESGYIEAGIKIGQEYGFPEKLLAVMRQHSTGFELPKSVEAAVVMLSDCIISTKDFLEKDERKGKISDKQLVTSIFQNRLNKGNLAQSGMTEEQIQVLKEFYIENIFAEEKWGDI